IKGLPFLADTVYGRIDSPIRLRGLEEILGGLKQHLFNDTLWPDFTRLPEEGSPTFELQPLKEGGLNTVGHLRVTPIRVNHVIPATGFIIEDEEGAVLYSGDTFETGPLWEAAARHPRLKAAMIEASFPDSMSELAERSGHLTPRLLAREFEKIGRPGLPLLVYHMKPQFREEISEEVRKLGIENVRCLTDGETITID
ncbi:MAG TPA: 3',5'-cyclic-nucleotide phosphodiesterase, partial [Nitrospiria bacterium]|nr:3',5'-cyclic-nucleotide phosphodiesterase [Nitrospiria bacterium]